MLVWMDANGPRDGDARPAADDRPTRDVGRRVDVIVRSSDLGPVADALVGERSDILERWLTVASRQPFHREHPERAVTDHIPALFDAIVETLRRPGDRDEEPIGPLDDEAVASAAVEHAQTRFEQGLGPVAVVTEFRILRQEIGRALERSLEGDATPSDVVAGMTLVGDAIDGAATVGLTALSDRIETTRESFLATTLHDVRQPMTLVEGSLHLADRWLAEAEPDRARLSEAVTDALLATIELVEMIDTLSDASRVAMGALDAELEPADLEHIVRDAVGAFGPAGRERVRIEVNGQQHLIGMWDPSLLRRLVANLVGNALKYSPADRPVVVVIGPGGGHDVRLEVHDQGIGMDRGRARPGLRALRADRPRPSERCQRSRAWALRLSRHRGRPWRQHHGRLGRLRSGNCGHRDAARLDGDDAED